MKNTLKASKIKKAKLITDGGFWTYVKIPGVVPKVHVPLMRKLRITTDWLDFSEAFHFDLIFALVKVHKNYAEYRQVEVVRLDSPAKPDSLHSKRKLTAKAKGV